MKHGKRIFATLREVRKLIADANSIEFDATECTHQGDCRGTCPKCEAELHYLENQLSLRRATGEAVVVTGIALSAMNVYAQTPEPVAPQLPQKKANIKQDNLNNSMTMIDYYFLIHFVLYRFRKKHGEDSFGSLVDACLVHKLMFLIFIMGVEKLISELLNFPSIFSKSLVVALLLFFLLIDYFIFLRGNRYIEVFSEYYEIYDTPVMKKKLRYSRIFNWSLFVIDLILLFIADYLNHL